MVLVPKGLVLCQVTGTSKNGLGEESSSLPQEISRTPMCSGPLSWVSHCSSVRGSELQCAVSANQPAMTSGLYAKQTLKHPPSLKVNKQKHFSWNWTLFKCVFSSVIAVNFCSRWSSIWKFMLEHGFQSYRYASWSLSSPAFKVCVSIPEFKLTLAGLPCSVQWVTSWPPQLGQAMPSRHLSSTCQAGFLIQR